MSRLVRAFNVSLPARYALDAADRYPPELVGRFDLQLNRSVDVWVPAEGLEWLRGDAALYIDPAHFRAEDLPDGLRAAARVADRRLRDPAEAMVEEAFLNG